MEDINTSLIKNILFVNSAVLSLSDYINSDTIEIGYDTHVSTIIPSAKNHNNVTRIGFAFHYSGEDDDHEAFFTDSDLGESVETFSPNVQSILDLLLGGGITHVDFLACGTLTSEKWRLFYQLLRLKTGVVIGASDDNTGNMKLGGDWIMESTHEEVGQIYFTAAIENWASLLALPTGLNQYYHTFYTINATTPAVITRTIYNNSGTMQDTQDISFGGMPIKDVFSLINGGGGTTNPYAIGIVDSSLNKICMDIAYCGVYTKPLTDRQKTKLMTYVNTTFKEPHAYANFVYTVTVSGGVYWMSTNGVAAVQKPNLTMAVGNIYVFDQSHVSNTGFPLLLSTTASSPAYDVGVVTNSTPGSLNAYTLIDVIASTSLPLYYYCTNTANMGPVPVLPIIWYTFEVENGITITNSGTEGTGGDATISLSSLNTISYDTTTYRKGSKSLHNNTEAGYDLSSYVSLPDVSLNGSGCTFCFWMYRIDSGSNKESGPFTFESTRPNSVSPLDAYCLYNHSSSDSTRDKLYINWLNQLHLNWVDMPKFTWKHIAITINRSTKNVTLYSNGNSASTFTLSSNVPESTKYFRFMSSNVYMDSLKGNMDDYRIYNSELSAADILSVYNN